MTTKVLQDFVLVNTNSTEIRQNVANSVAHKSYGAQNFSMEIPTGDILIGLRVACEIPSQDKLAAISGLSSQSISEYENSIKLDMYDSTKKKLSDAFGITIAEFNQALKISIKPYARNATARKPEGRIPDELKEKLRLFINDIRAKRANDKNVHSEARNVIRDFFAAMDGLTLEQCEQFNGFWQVKLQQMRAKQNGRPMPIGRSAGGAG